MTTTVRKLEKHNEKKNPQRNSPEFSLKTLLKSLAASNSHSLGADFKQFPT